MLPSSCQALLKASKFAGRRPLPSLRRLDTQRIRFLYLERQRAYIGSCTSATVCKRCNKLLAHMFAQSVTLPSLHYFYLLYGVLVCTLEYVGMPNGANDHI